MFGGTPKFHSQNRWLALYVSPSSQYLAMYSNRGQSDKSMDKAGRYKSRKKEKCVWYNKGVPIENKLIFVVTIGRFRHIEVSICRPTSATAYRPKHQLWIIETGASIHINILMTCPHPTPLYNVVCVDCLPTSPLYNLLRHQCINVVDLLTGRWGDRRMTKSWILMT
jgi:hypothetical protein